MSSFVVDKAQCKKDGACIQVCPGHVLAFGADGFPEEIPDRPCVLCGHCVAVCPHQALTHTGLPDEPMLPAAEQWPSPALLDGLLMGRRSVREFKHRPVSRDVLESLLDVARRAPTACNSQLIHWIVVEGEDKVHAVAAEAVEGARAAGAIPALVQTWDAGYDFVLRGAPAVVLACAPAEYDWGKEDSVIALTYLELAAEARGLGVCWAGFLMRFAALHEPLRRLLAVPEGFAVRGALMLGEGTFTYRRIPPRKPLSVQWN